MKSINLADLKVIAMQDLESALKAGATEVQVSEGTIFTPSARDFARQKGIALRNGIGGGNASAGGGKTSASPAGSNSNSERLFHSPEAEAIKAEIIAVGRKLWQRAYVDGNGGNISYRIGPNAVLCTPTLISKADLKPEDLCLVDLEGNQLVGERPRTSEILLHLEIYKEVPQAKAVVHCHPPHATAYAITGRVPPTCVIPEYEVFIGSVAVSPYETPGTTKFAQTVIPFVKQHNTVLLSNHGIVCWADTVTHAEWYAEVVDTYCWTLMLAAQLGTPISQIPCSKAGDLLAIKKKMGLPDARYELKECQLCDFPDMPGNISMAPPAPAASDDEPASAEDVESLVRSVTDAVMTALSNGEKPEGKSGCSCKC